MNVTMKHETLSNGYAPIYKLSFTYLERQNSNDLYKLSQLYDLVVKYQGQVNVMLVCDTPSNDHVPTYKILLTDLESEEIMA